MKQRKKTVTRQMLDDARKFFDKYDNNVTRRAFVSNYKRFIDYCRTEFDCRTKEECCQHIQEYADNLVGRGLSASTVHSYLAPVGLFHSVPLDGIKKPKRVTAQYKRSRSDNGKAQRSDNDISNPKYARTVEFQMCVGIRRAELKRLKGRDFGYDGSGYPVVIVEKGKGGRRQEQRLLPEDVEFVKSYFRDKDPDELIFSPEEFKNKIDYHHLRALQAQRAYDYYAFLCQTKEGREQLEQEVRLRYETTKINKKTGKPALFKEHLIRGNYYLRGENRKLAKLKGLPTKYDKLCLMAVSVFHLAHFRNDTTVFSYILHVLYKK